jgi:predicted acyl esterase
LRNIIDFPFNVNLIENAWIQLRDGNRLAARIWLPETAMKEPVPAILEYIPYRKNDFTAEYDSMTHPYFAGHGYACIRVDIRGSGDSDGILVDEYSKQEHDDALEVLQWIVKQPWCSGEVGIIGISWGGFNGLQIAARGPPELKAVITVCSTDDRYADDVHYIGGCVLGVGMLGWASTMLVYNAIPPDPTNVGDRWRDMWIERLESSPHLIESWLTHQKRDAYWKHGSVCEDYSAITCPVYAIGGWADGYTNAVMRLLEGLPLKDIDTGIMDEPRLRVLMQDSVFPSIQYTERPGRWVAENSWPSNNIIYQRYWLNENSLDKTPNPEVKIKFSGLQTTGIDAGKWCPFGLPGDFPPDQRREDGESLSFTSALIKEKEEILGTPKISLVISVDKPNALIAVRLCDIAQSGTSTLVSRGLLNLTHRNSHENPKPLEPDERYTINVNLKATSYSLPIDHRWRVALSPTYWPIAWPSPEPVTLTVFTGESSHLNLPIRTSSLKDAKLTPFEPPERSLPLKVEVIRSPSLSWKNQKDVINNFNQITIKGDRGLRRIDSNEMVFEHTYCDKYIIQEGNPLSAQVYCERKIGIERGNWCTRVEAKSKMWADLKKFYVTNHLDAYERDTKIFSRERTIKFPRELV